LRCTSLFVALALVSLSILGAVLINAPNTGAVDTSAPPYLIYSNPTNPTTQQTYPDVTVTGDGRIYVVWTRSLGANLDIMFSYSTNNGTSFTSPRVINANTTGNQADPHIAVTDSGVVIVIWVDRSGTGGDIVCARSLDGGETFETEQVVHSDIYRSLLKSPDIAASGDEVAVVWDEEVRDNSIRIWNAGTGALVRTLEGHDAATLCLEYSPGGDVIASGGEDGLLKIWNANSGALVQNLTEHDNYITSLNWSSDGTRLVTGSYDQNVTIWDTSNYNIITRLNQVDGVLMLNYVNTVSLSPDTSQVATGYFGKLPPMVPQGPPADMFNLTVWNLSDYSNWTVNEDTVGHTNEVMDVSFSHNGTMIASCSKDDTVKVWNATTGGKLLDLDLGTEDVLSLSWSPDDTQIAAGLANGTIVVFDLNNTAVQYWLKTHTSRVNSVSWSEVRDEIASGASESKAKVWELTGKTERLNLSGHLNSVYSVDWSSNGNFIATGGGNSNQYNMGEKQIFCAVSTDAGQTYSAPAVISNRNLAIKSQPRVGMDSNNNIHVVWYITGSGVGIFYANSTNGVTFSGDLKISSGSEWVTPEIAVESNGCAHVVWQQKNGKTNIHYANSSDGFSNDVQISADGQLPKIAASRSGSVIWATWRPTGYPLMGNVSYDHGLSFDDLTTVNSSQVSASAVSVDPYGQASFVWIDWEKKEIYHVSTVLHDTWKPTATGTHPAHNAVGVSVFTNILVNFSEPMDRASVEAAFSVNNATHNLDAGDCSLITWNGYGDKVNFTLDTPLDYNNIYVVKITNTAEDLSGNTLSGNTPESDYVFTFTTRADVDAPVIEYVQLYSEWSYDEPYPIEVTVIDWWGSVTAADLHYRGVSDTGFTTLALTNAGNNNYTATIPAQGELGNVSYYFTAADNHGNSGRLPVSPAQYFNYAVVDGVDPTITHIPEDAAAVHQPIEVSAVVTDGIELVAVELHYMGMQDSNYTGVAMTADTSFDPNGFSCEIPAQQEVGELRYSISAWDGSNNIAVTDIFLVDIIDLTKPEINSVIPEYRANETEVLVRANITDNVAVDEVTLYFKAVGGDHWVERNMNNVGGDIYEFTIPAQRKSGTIYYYVNATDTSDNLASTLTEQDQFGVEVIGTGPNNTVYYVLAIVLVALVVVLVYLMVTKFGGKPKSPVKTPESEVGSEQAQTPQTEGPTQPTRNTQPEEPAIPESMPDEGQ
jgi:WD40 repeat protein